MSNEDVFSSLYRWARRQGENFTTDALMYVVNEMIDRDPPMARSFLGRLCFDDENCEAFRRELPRIRSQCRDENGIPDIWVETRDDVVLVEVKKGSDLHKDQLRQYHKILAADGRRGRLVLLTVYHATYEPDEKPHHWWRWADVERWLVEQATMAADPILSFLLQQFLAFLRSQVMTVNRVEWQYVEGVKSMVNLAAKLEEACKANSLTGTRGTAAWASLGLSIGAHFWTGVYFGEPDVVVFEYTKVEPAALNNFEQLAGWHKRPDNGHYATKLNLSDATTHFFALDKYSQQQCLTEFIRRAHAEAQGCTAGATASNP